LSGGGIQVYEVDSRGVRAEVNLKFHSRSIRESGFFSDATPHWQAMWDDEEVKRIREHADEEIERLRKQETGGEPSR